MVYTVYILGYNEIYKYILKDFIKNYESILFELHVNDCFIYLPFMIDTFTGIHGEAGVKRTKVNLFKEILVNEMN